jgi:hypothetical protein
MRRTPIVLLAVLLPATVLAINFTDVSGKYKDAPFSKPEAAGISVLTQLGAVGGNPDGTFAPKRTLNRAEFLKIVLPLVPSGTWDFSLRTCFPDVKTGDWFSSYVCAAKDAKVIQGYPDGLFHPERAVNYVEALKMLDVLFSYEITAAPADQWFMPYIRAASVHGTQLPVSINADTSLTRGQMARLAAGFVAENQGQLAEYRSFEQGLSVSSSSSSMSMSSSSLSSSDTLSSSVSSSLSSSSLAAVLPELPARSHLLLLGSLSKSIASGKFYSPLEPVLLRSIKVKLKAKADYISSLTVVDAEGVVLGNLSLDPFDSTDLTWKTTFSGSGAYEIPKEGERVLAVEALLKGWSDGGVAEKLVQVDSFTIVTQGEWSQDTYNFAPQTYDYPQHQTVQALITGVTNVGPEDSFIPRGSHQLLAAFSFSGVVLLGTNLKIRQLEFTANKSGMAVQNWQIGTPGSTDYLPCSVNDASVSCLSLPDDFGTVDPSTPRVLQLYGDVSVDDGAKNPSLEVDLTQPGQIGENGAIRWTDGTGDYTWTELSTPVARGTKWSE